MPDASDIEEVDMLSPFLGTLSDCLCGIDTGPNTRVFTVYVDRSREVLNIGKPLV